MAARPTKEITAQRERAAWDLRQRSWTQDRIAGELGVDVSTICRMLRRANMRLAKEFTDRAEEIKAEQAARLAYIEDEAMRAWERSQSAAESARTVTEELFVRGEEETLGDDGEVIKRKRLMVPVTKVTTTSASDGQCGDPRYLDQARGAMADIRQIWGLDASKKTDITSGGAAIQIREIVIERQSPAEEEA